MILFVTLFLLANKHKGIQFEFDELQFKKITFCVLSAQPTNELLPSGFAIIVEIKEI